MDALLQWLDSSTALLLPLASGLAAFALLMLIYRLLARISALRAFAILYTLGALTLGVVVGLILVPSQWSLAVDSMPRKLLLALLILCWSFIAIGLLENLLIERWMLRNGTKVPRLARDIVRALAFVVGVLFAIRFVFAIPLDSIVISSTVLSAVIGLAFQDLLKNVIAGIALQMERPFDVGHWVQVDNQIGRVVEMSWRATRVITVDGNYIIYPNSLLAQAELTNYTLGSPIQALHVQVALGYGHPPNLVKHVLTEAVLAANESLAEPPPSIKLIQYGDYSVTYDIKFWVKEYDRYPEKKDAVMTNVWYFLRRAGIKLPTPIREIYMHQVDPLGEADQHHMQIEHVVANLRGVDLFAVLDNTELHALAEHAQVRLYGVGEVLARQGEPGDSFFIICSGRVRIDVGAGNNGGAVTVNHLGAGEFFGELALLTGEPRGATVVAEEDTETLVVARNDLAPLLQANSALPERLGEVLARRLEMNQLALALPASAGAPSDALSRPTLVHRIRHLFGLNGQHDKH